MNYFLPLSLPAFFCAASRSAFFSFRDGKQVPGYIPDPKNFFRRHFKGLFLNG
jgi:hypothetical protein